MPDEQADGLRKVAALTYWWGQGVFLFLTVSILFLGIGRLELPFTGVRFSAWSISRTTFFFWLIWKCLLWFHHGRHGLGLEKVFPLPLFALFIVVTASLLPDFHEADDYRYFFFAVMHCVIVLDLFAAGDRRSLLLLSLGLLPGFLVLRGLVYNPSILNFSSVLDFGVRNRFAYPLAHPNPAGLLFSMSIPLALAIVISQKGWLRGLTLGSLGAQFVGLILTYSRGAWLGCIVSLLGVCLVEYSLRKAVLTLGLTAVIAFLVIAPLRGRLLTLLNPRDDIAIEGRFEFMFDALAVGFENPFIGVGYGRDRLREGIKQEIPNAQQVGFIPHSHNLYTEMLAETGLLGLGALLWVVLSNIKRLFSRARKELSPPVRTLYLSLAASLIAFLVSGMADVPFYNHDTRIFFFTLLAVTYLFLRSDKPLPRGTVYNEQKVEKPRKVQVPLGSYNALRW